MKYKRWCEYGVDQVLILMLKNLGWFEHKDFIDITLGTPFNIFDRKVCFEQFLLHFQDMGSMSTSMLYLFKNTFNDQISLLWTGW